MTEPTKRVLIDRPSGATLLAARHLDHTEGPVQVGRPLTDSDRAAINTVLRYVAAAHNAPPLGEAPEIRKAETERDGAYRERAHLLAWLAALYPAVTTPAPDVDEPGWLLLFLDLDGRQVSWHIAPADAGLFAVANVPRVDPGDPRATWDGHTTPEKYERILAHVASLATSRSAWQLEAAEELASAEAHGLIPGLPAQQRDEAREQPHDAEPAAPRPGDAPSPRYRTGDVIRDTTHGGDRELEVVAVGREAYFVRRLDWRSGDLEPRETAWGIQGCEEATELARRVGGDDAPRPGDRLRVTYEGVATELARRGGLMVLVTEVDGDRWHNIVASTANVEILSRATTAPEAGEGDPA